MLKDIYTLLDPASRRQYFLLAIISVGSSLLQTLGVAAISLFFTLLLGGTPPLAIQQTVKSLPFETLGLGILLLTVSGTLSSALATYYGVQLSWSQYEKISVRLLRQFLHNNYEWHIQQNSAALAKTVITEAQIIVSQVLQQSVLILVRGTEILFISCLLIVTKPSVALVVVTSFGVVYTLLFRLKRISIREQGRAVAASNTERQRTVNEALGGIKAVKVAETEEFFVQRFRRAAQSLGHATAKIHCYSLMPKYWIELTLFSGLISFMIFSQANGWDTSQSVPLLALYGAAAIRLLPAAQQLYSSLATITASHASLQSVVEHLRTSVHRDPRELEPSFDDSIVRLREVSYRYPGSETPSLQDFNLTVSAGEKIGIVGMTGAGKTTLVDLLLGLLSPQEGNITYSATQTGRPNVAYVPQHIHFIDDTIAANIALGVDLDKRDLKLIEQAALMARIDEHIKTLKEGYDTCMGESGVRFSGGQRQRIGIARALYSKPSLLVLDEASNALDAETEHQIISGLLDQDLTLIIIAHRLSILRNCTRIVMLDKGRVIDTGTFQDLLNRNSNFKNLALADLGQPV